MAKRTAIGEIIKVLNQRDQRSTVGKVVKSEKDPTTWVDPLKHASNHETGGSDTISVDDTMIGNRTITDTATPTSNTSTLQNLLSWIGYMIKAITGKADWRTAPAISLQSTYTHVDNENIHVHMPCKVATTGNITLSGEQTIDGISCVAGDRVLVYRQTTSTQNGIYVVASGAWTRATDMNETEDLSSGAMVWVSQGTTNAKLTFKLTTVDPMTLDSTSLVFERTSFQDITKEPTGFSNPQNVTVSYDSSTRKITLTGTVEAWWQGIRVTQLVSGWVSDAHADVTGYIYYLYYNGTSFVFDTSPWSFDMLQIAYVQYGSVTKYGGRECHGVMPWECHRSLHLTVGTVLSSGGDLSGYTPLSTTAANRRPDISATYVLDEDLETTNAALTSKLYTIRYLVGSGAVRTFAVDQADFLLLSGNQPYYNQYTGGAWTQTLMDNNKYAAVFVVAVPTSADATSQKLRYMFLQPQQQGDLTTIQALTTNSVNLGDTSLLSKEFVFIAKIIIRYQSSNWDIHSVTKLTGSQLVQVSGSGFLSYVTADESTITGSGTAASPILVKDAGITLAKMADVASGTVFYRKTAGSGAPEVQTLATLAADLGVTGGGAAWYDGAGVPSDGLGADGDYYLNDTNGDVYKKASGTWGSPVANIKGATGATGTVGDYAEGTHSSLDFYYDAGKVRANNVIHTTAAGHVALTDDTTNYIEVNPTSGVVSANTTGFTSDRTPLFTAVTSGGAITTVTDCRCFFNSGGSGIAWFSTIYLPTTTSVTTGLAITTITKP